MLYRWRALNANDWISEILNTVVLTLKIHGWWKHGGSVDVLDVGPAAHNSTLWTGGGRMMDAHGPTGPGWVVGAGHGSGRRRIPVGRLRHLAARRQITIRTWHVAQTSWVHGGALEATRIKTRLIQIRIVHNCCYCCALCYL